MPIIDPRRPYGRSRAVRAAACAALGVCAAFAPARADDAPAGAGPDVKTRSEVVRVVEELRTEAAKIRRLAWKHDVPADLLTRDQLKKELEAMILEDFKPDEYARDKKILQRLGLITADEDPLEMTKRFLEQGIAGFYNPKTKRLYIIDGLSVEAQRPTMLHELIHALEDQYIDLETRQKAVEKDSDALFALKCTIEGSAERARKIYEKANPEIAKLSQREQARSQNMEELTKTLRATPAILFVPSLLHYQMGPALVTRYVGADYPGGMERMYAGDAPSTQEQCVHPGRFVTADRDLPRAIGWPAKLAEAAGADWKGLEAQPTGELDFALWMSHWIGGNQGRISLADAGGGRMWAKGAGAAAEGWDGMKVQVFEKAGVPTGVALASAWDTHQDAVEAGNALEGALRGQHGDAFQSGAWTDAGGGKGRVLDFTGPYGAGRLAVRDDLVLALDGFPAGTFAAVWATLESTTFTRDAKDTWSETTKVNPVATASWKGVDVGWNVPDEMWVADEAPGVYTKGDLVVRLRAEKGAVQAVFLKAFVAAKQKSPKAKIDPTTVSQFSIDDKTAIRLDYDDPGTTEAGATRHSLILLIHEDLVVVVTASAPAARWTAASKELDAALEGFVWKE